MTDSGKPEHVKVGERQLRNGILVEYYCATDGPSLQECIDKVAEIGAEAIMRRGLNNERTSTRVISSEER